MTTIHAVRPQNCRGSIHELWALGMLRGVLLTGAAEIIDERVPSIEELSGLVVFAHFDGTIDAESLAAVFAALAADLPVACLVSTQRTAAYLTEFAGVQMLPVGDRSAERIATLVYGSAINNAAGYFGIEATAA